MPGCRLLLLAGEFQSKCSSFWHMDTFFQRISITPLVYGGQMGGNSHLIGSVSIIPYFYSLSLESFINLCPDDGFQDPRGLPTQYDKQVARSRTSDVFLLAAILSNPETLDSPVLAFGPVC